MSATENALINEPDRVILYDDLGSDIVYDIAWSSTPGIDAFRLQFEVAEDLGSRIVADPTEDYYQGISFMRVIRRRRDGRLFGFSYWEDISKRGEMFVEHNGDEHGLEFEPPADFDWVDGYFPAAYVFLPVEPFTITGYKTVEVAK